MFPIDLEQEEGVVRTPGESQEGNGNNSHLIDFNFDSWIANNNELLAYKQLFIKHNMCSSSNLTLCNANFANLIADVSNKQHVAYIVNAIQTLHDKYIQKSMQSSTNNIVFVNEVENNVLLMLKQKISKLKLLKVSANTQKAIHRNITLDTNMKIENFIIEIQLLFKHLHTQLQFKENEILQSLKVAENQTRNESQCISMMECSNIAIIDNEISFLKKQIHEWKEIMANPNKSDTKADEENTDRLLSEIVQRVNHSFENMINRKFKKNVLKINSQQKCIQQRNINSEMHINQQICSQICEEQIPNICSFMNGKYIIIDDVSYINQKENEKKSDLECSQVHIDIQCANISENDSMMEKMGGKKNKIRNNPKSDCKIMDDDEYDWKSCSELKIFVSDSTVISNIPNYFFSTYFGSHFAIRLIAHQGNRKYYSRVFKIATPSKLLIVAKNARKVLKSGKIHTYDFVVLEENAILTVAKKSEGQLLLFIKSDLIMNVGSVIDMTGKGCAGGSEYTQGSSIDGNGHKYYTTPNKGGGGGCGQSKFAAGGGGSYGTFGSNGNGFYTKLHRINIDGTSGECYGDANLNVLHFGSGGGGGWTTFVACEGGNGGGIIGIQCEGSIIMKDSSRIICNGLPGKYEVDGCGSGGSIKLVCNAFCMHLTAKISAVGGIHQTTLPKANESIVRYGGSGGHGRIRICCHSFNIPTNELQENVIPGPSIEITNETGNRVNIKSPSAKLLKNSMSEIAKKTKATNARNNNINIKKKEFSFQNIVSNIFHSSFD